MNQLISLDAIIVDSNPSWSTTLGHINEISKQLETHKILDCLWDIIRESGASGFSYFLSTNIGDVEGMSGVKVYQYGSAIERSAEIRRTYQQVSEANTKDIEIALSDCRKGSTISCPVFGPYNSKGLYIIQRRKLPEHILSTEVETLNYILLKSQIYIAEIEAKQKN